MGLYTPARAPVPSPCVGVCTLDQHGQCMGCRRSADEIARWLTMSDNERRAVLARLAQADETESP